MKIYENELLAPYSSFRTGGKADLLLMPENAEELISALSSHPEAAVFGNLSNTLITDKGIRGCVIITKLARAVSVSGCRVTAEAGAPLSSVAAAAMEAGLTGVEFLYGIPGSAGGGVFMNCGAYGGEIASAVENVTLWSSDKGVFTINKDELEAGYRSTILMKKPYIMIKAVFALENGDKHDIKAVMDDLMQRRSSTQPLEYPSCGSTFKRPEGHYAGKLIADCGLKGLSVGGAAVSEKHAGFVINKGGATSSDILALIDKIKKEVYGQTGVMLEEEIKIAGEK